MLSCPKFFSRIGACSEIFCNMMITSDPMEWQQPGFAQKPERAPLHSDPPQQVSDTWSVAAS